MKSLLTCLLSLAVPTVCLGGNWDNWRGPNGNGTADGKGYVTEWSADKNIKWKVKLPGRGSSTPAIWGENIFLTCVADGKNVVLCLGRDGKERWKKTLGSSVRGKKRSASGCNPSPITDGKLVFVYFKSGELACFDTTGNLKWKTNLQEKYGKDTLWWDLGTSPVLTKDNVVVAVMQSNNSYVVAYNKQSGKLAWKQDRNLGAPVEAEHSYSTPIVTTHNSKEALIILGADHVTAHDATNGKEIWRVSGLNPGNNKYFRSIASPVLAGDLLVAPYSRGSALHGIKLGGTGDVTKTHVKWTKSLGRGGPKDDVPTPAYQSGKVFIAGDRGRVACYDAKTGDRVWSSEAGRRRMVMYSSPTIGDGKIYVTYENGTMVVLSQKDGKVLGTNSLGEITVSTPVLVDGVIYQRTHDHLWCIGK